MDMWSALRDELLHGRQIGSPVGLQLKRWCFNSTYAAAGTVLRLFCATASYRADGEVKLYPVALGKQYVAVRLAVSRDGTENCLERLGANCLITLGAISGTNERDNTMWGLLKPHCKLPNYAKQIDHVTRIPAHRTDDVCYK
jgi:hypothetical protein